METTDLQDSSGPFRVWDCNLPFTNKRKIMWKGRVGGFSLVSNAQGGQSLWTREVTGDCFLVQLGQSIHPPSRSPPDTEH